MTGHPAAPVGPGSVRVRVRAGGEERTLHFGEVRGKYIVNEGWKRARPGLPALRDNCQTVYTDEKFALRVFRKKSRMLRIWKFLAESP